MHAASTRAVFGAAGVLPTAQDDAGDGGESQREAFPPLSPGVRVGGDGAVDRVLESAAGRRPLGADTPGSRASRERLLESQEEGAEAEGVVGEKGAESESESRM